MKIRKIRIAVDFNVDLETDGEELDMDVIRAQAQECLRTHVENMMSNELELERLVDDMSECTCFLVNGIGYDVEVD